MMDFSDDLYRNWEFFILREGADDNAILSKLSFEIQMVGRIRLKMSHF